MRWFTYLCAQSLQSCPSLCDSVDCSPPSSSVHGIVQARILEWVAMPSSWDCSTLFILSYWIAWSIYSSPVLTWVSPDLTTTFTTGTPDPCSNLLILGQPEFLPFLRWSCQLFPMVRSSRQLYIQAWSSRVGQDHWLGCLGKKWWFSFMAISLRKFFSR